MITLNIITRISRSFSCTVYDIVNLNITILTQNIHCRRELVAIFCPSNYFIEGTKGVCNYHEWSIAGCLYPVAISDTYVNRPHYNCIRRGNKSNAEVLKCMCGHRCVVRSGGRLK